MTDDRASLAKQLFGDFVVILIFGALALGIHAMGLHLAEQKRQLRTEGVTVQVEVTRVLRGLPRKVDVTYEHAGQRYAREVLAPEPTPTPGQRMAGVIHPERPERVRIRGLDEASIEEERKPFQKLPMFFGLPLAILVVARVAKLKGKNPLAAVGPMVGAVLLLLIAGLNFESDIQAVIHQRIGPKLLGLPSPFGVALLQIVLLGPLMVLWGGAAVQLAALAMKSGRPSRGLGFILWVMTSDAAKAEASLRRRFLGAGGALLLALVLAGVWLSAT